MAKSATNDSQHDESEAQPAQEEASYLICSAGSRTRHTAKRWCACALLGAALAILPVAHASAESVQMTDTTEQSFVLNAIQDAFKAGGSLHNSALDRAWKGLDMEKRMDDPAFPKRPKRNPELEQPLHPMQSIPYGRQRRLSFCWSASCREPLRT